MPLSLFDYDPPRHFESVFGESDRFGHTFGGSAEDYGIRFTNSDTPLHVIYRLNTKDTSVRVARRGINWLHFFERRASWLPLCYGFHHNSDWTNCYRVVSDREIELVAPAARRNLLWDEAPPFFPGSPLRFSRIPYDPQVADDVVRLKGVFGWDELSQAEVSRVLELIRQSELSQLDVADAPDDDWTYEDVIRNMFHPPLYQNWHHASCPNPKCKDPFGLRIIAIHDNPAESECFWPDSYVQTIWSLCRSCHCITASNQL